MSDGRQQAAGGGIGLGGLLTLVFVVAKVWNQIDWPWVWVFSPLWLPLGLAIGLAGVILLVTGTLYVGATAVEAVTRPRSTPDRRQAKKR